MNTQSSLITPQKWQQQAEKYQIEGNYLQAARLYELAIDAEPDVKLYYWRLGLMLLLQGQQVEAQTTWFMTMVEGEPEEVELWNAELVQVLQTEAQRLKEQADYVAVWRIRQQIKEICPTDINNLLHLILLTIKLQNNLDEGLTTLLEVIEILRSEQQVVVDFELLMQMLQSVLEYAPLHPSTQELVEACLTHVRARNQTLTFLSILLPAMVNIGHIQWQPVIAARFAESYLQLDGKNTEVLRHLACFYQNAKQYDQGIETAKLCYSLVTQLADTVSVNQLVLRGLMTAGGYWEEARSVFQRHESLLLKLIEEQPTDLSSVKVSRLFNSYFFAPYFRDNPRNDRQIQNQLAQLCQANTKIYANEEVEKYSQRHQERQRPGVVPKKLKIGYLSYCLRGHSVGWLARWLFQHHDRDRFQLHGYFINNYNITEPLHQWFLGQVDKVHKASNSYEIVEQIYNDEIDILIDLDSITLDVSCEVLAIKPAPIQVTWLGWDATGIPGVDYFIADRYVLPEYAQEYYSEKIWRLPTTYIAVDGFEVGVPNLRREHLDIPSDAIVYLSAQKSYKRNADTVRLQMQIIKAVPNSYFLIKGTAEEESLKNFFYQIAEEEGVDCAKLRFIPDVPSESVHRANLGIADVVLDTYPYNGATTTLETLWMCIPLVTRVGEQFAARNSYTMMMNAGITEGIAWSDEEYVEWGVRLGKDQGLRDKIACKLKSSRQTAPLWNAKQFTREMEKAYEQMWQRYMEGDS
ncbi:O-linked N-acetylglucosamine transferase, SPINDLY family protein [Iningainema tapete]|uniref:O-linked N-acetylglucosamine transferase, SPINDLY family protein n=1 Tax=Iningainema tapete BLCC-T55 TaxID=2748662 RepID=A0A8J6XHD5_9CYAN|nr:O-linked N-acetylglucosamine transferase, SPINDLY family protein [Iningainema tapete]MBD2773425.1 O-linked N-acetylglucosamine transferase, SPINDLY family protein [Iningainema tapete BLCC-T55]